MALETTITLDLEFKEGNITVKSGDDDVEVIDYSDDEIIFESRLGINITGVEFLDLIKQFEIFQKALLVNFKLNQFSRDSFTKITTVEEHNTFLNTWNLDITPQNNPKLIDYQANGSDKTVDLAIRALSNTISYSEFVYVLGLLKHYKDSVKKFLNI